MLNEEIFFDTMRQGLWVAVVVSLPILTVALLAGLTVGLFQALTSIQELTLTFVPKIAAMILVAVALLGWIANQLVDFATILFQG